MTRVARKAGVTEGRQASPQGGRRRDGGEGARSDQPQGRKEKKKEPPDPFADTSPLGLLKREAAERLGLVDKVRSVGWAGLSAAETGRVGALVSRLARERAGRGGREGAGPD